MIAKVKILFVGFLQQILPHHFLSRIIYYVMRVEKPWFKNTVIRGFMRIYGVSLENAEKPEAGDYPTFNAFFTRQLKDDARPIADGDRVIVSPADGMVSQAGVITDGKIVQAKGCNFALNTLVGDSLKRTRLFQDGHFATIYLSPKDYHRVHIPATGTLLEMSHIPGRLFSVNDISTQAIPGLFARNERVVTLFDSPLGPMCVILVGAIFVSSMETVWQGVITPPGGRWMTEYRYPDGVTLNKGEELGRFNMGSTVILLFAKGRISWSETMKPGYIVRMGQAIGERAHSLTDDK